MNDGASVCQCVVDTNGLHEIASEASGNLKAVLLEQLKSGVIGVPSCAWNEFQELFEAEAEQLADFVPTKITLAKKAYTVKVATLAEKLNSGFNRGPYDRGADLYTAAIAAVEDYIVLTTKSEIPAYGPLGCKVMDLATWVGE